MASVWLWLVVEPSLRRSSTTSLSRVYHQWFIVCLVSCLPSAGGNVPEAGYDGAMTKFEGWVQGSSASSLAAADPWAFHDLFGVFVGFHVEEGWAHSSASPSLAAEVPCAYLVVSEELRRVVVRTTYRPCSLATSRAVVLCSLAVFSLFFLPRLVAWLSGVAPSVSLPCLGFDRWWKHPLVFQLFEFAAMPFSSILKTKAFAGMRKGKMLWKGWTDFCPGFLAYCFRPQVVTAGCAAAALVFLSGYSHFLSSMSAAAFLACALNIFVALVFSPCSTVEGVIHGTEAAGVPVLGEDVLCVLDSTAAASDGDFALEERHSVSEDDEKVERCELNCSAAAALEFDSGLVDLESVLESDGEVGHNTASRYRGSGVRTGGRPWRCSAARRPVEVTALAAAAFSSCISGHCERSWPNVNRARGPPDKM